MATTELKLTVSSQDLKTTLQAGEIVMAKVSKTGYGLNIKYPIYVYVRNLNWINMGEETVEATAILNLNYLAILIGQTISTGHFAYPWEIT